MFKKVCLSALLIVLALFILTGCKDDSEVKIGVALGVGPAARWPQEIEYMKSHCETLGVELETRFNTDEEKKPLAEDCKELIDNGVDVLIIRPRDINALKDVVDYAHENDVEVISYDSLIEKADVDLFVGYDGKNMGQLLSQYLTETVPSGDYILLWGDSNRNVEDMYLGAQKYLEPLSGDIDVILEAEVPGWSPEEAKRIVKKAIQDNDNQVAAILAFNDTLAGACAEVVEELGIENPVAIAGMDADLDAVKRILAGTQGCTAYMDLKEIAESTIDEAVKLAKGEAPKVNDEITNNGGYKVPAYLLTRKLVTKMNLDRILIDSGYYTKEEVYGPAEN